MVARSGSGYAWITPTLHLGPLPHLSRAVSVTTAADALAAIHADKVAVLPAGAWDEAAQVLRGLALPEELIADRLHLAQHGEILPQ